MNTVADELPEEGKDEFAQALVRKVLSFGVDGIGPFSGSEQVAGEYLATHTDPEIAIARLIASHTRIAGGTGFATGVGGIAVAAFTLPADVTALYALSARCAGAIAVLRGYDVRSEEVRSVILLSLIGSAGASVLADLGVQIGTKSALSALKKVPGKALIEINKKVGFRLVTKFGTKGVVNLGKFVPLVGGAVGAGVNVATVRTIGNYAKLNFPARVIARPVPLGADEVEPILRSLEDLREYLALPNVFGLEDHLTTYADREVTLSVDRDGETIVTVEGVGTNLSFPCTYSEVLELVDSLTGER